MKILIAAGGSGGHIFPAIALARRLKEKRPETSVLFVGSGKDLDRRIFTKECLDYRLISANKMPYGRSIKLVWFGFALAADVIKSFIIMLSYRPDVVVGFGGYVSWPVAICASALGIRKVVHEQNVVPGRANKFLFNLADSIAMSFRESASALGKNAPKAVFTGNPIRDSVFRNDRAQGIKRLGLSSDKFTILVVGGSQGSRAINRSFIEAVSALDEDKKSAIQIVHITGIKDYEEVARSYEKAGLDTRTHSFIDRIEDAYSASDLVVTRSGASAIFEIAFFGRPMILVPYPYALAHQAENARVFTKNGAAVTLDEKGLDADSFRTVISELLSDRTRLSGMAVSAKKMSVPDASDRLADVVLEWAGKGR